MLKSIQKYARVALALSLILPLAQVPADASPSGSTSFKSGFSSQRSSSSSSSSASRAAKPSGGFGSFGSASGAQQRKSDSAMSRKLDRERSEANALRTLDERRQAQAARNAPSARPVPGYGQQDDRRTPPPPPPQGYGYGYGQAPAPTQPPVIVRQDSGLGHVVAGAIIAGAAANSHANTHASNGNNNNSGNGGGYYPAPGGGGGELAAKAGADAVGTATAGRDAAGRDAAGTEAAGQPAAHKASGGSIFGTVLWLLVLALIGWAVVFAWRRVRARREAGKPNYSFERN